MARREGSREAPSVPRFDSEHLHQSGGVREQQQLLLLLPGRRRLFGEPVEYLPAISMALVIALMIWDCSRG